MNVRLARFSAQPAELVNALHSAIASETPYSLTLRLSAVLVLLRGGSSAVMNVPLQVIGGLMLLFAPLSRQMLLWWALVLALVAGNYAEWHFVDNHKYLITYWTAACALSVAATRPEEFLRTTARLLIAVVFGFAVIWKVAGGEYVNGSFLYWTFLTDPRIQPVGALLAGVSLSEVTLASQAVNAFAMTGADGATLSLLSSSSLKNISLVLSWMVLIGEGAVAVLHVSGSDRLYAARHASLIGFIVFTYFLLPVVGFAFALAILGFAQTRDSDTFLRGVYLVLFVLVQLTVLPWQRLLNV